ncbi:MAG: CRISPR-associated primase-polymerase type B [Candidatus Azobacteroides sp.]|nr:CRISPR-associated primase-polymerase type B [Candidatus Azobacteroides sp.]
MLSFGKHITQKDDLLTSIDVQRLYNAIKQPDETTLTLINRLRLVQTIDKKQYNVMKRELSYVVCGIFNPPYRRIENFGYAEHFIIDIDHIIEKGLNLNDLRTKLVTDSRIMLCFVSPSEDGLKLLFRLNEKCYDAGRYSLFYKTFISAFAVQYGFQQVTDTVTSDVSRACFMSYDPEAFFNPEAETVIMKDYVDFDNPFVIGEIKHNLRQEDKDQKAEKSEKAVPDDTAIAFIKERLQARTRIPRQKPQVYVPDELEKILEKLLQYIDESGIQVENVENIQYGKKFRFCAGSAHAEINLFFGKRGFSVVKSPKHGTSESLNDLMVSYISSFIEDYVTY